ncbi:MotA/TolQ/ExbB proton channel family protein [Parvicella tangerina]|uniref:Tol-Pal system protein TolQ n=1 Tax=Parvicella tangerina TaxID=2829795 RepID=A0A916JQ95_9FLAO|nr:MotA/TolQ/ExbB proton channel family protein [Parvicella tangerina]CAG5086108.1 Tol-Pal system protein TolQ [Parvicella tangerina]
MKKVFTLLAVTGLLSVGSFAQDTTIVDNADGSKTAIVVDAATGDTLSTWLAEEAPAPEPEEVDESQTQVTAAEGDGAEEKEDFNIVQTLKRYFIDGSPVFMTFVLLTLILGLALSIERIIYLTMATTNNKKLLAKIEEALNSGGVEAAKEVCRNTRGPVASIFYQGLDRSSEGVDMAEKAVISYGGVQMGLLEKGLPWIGLMIALAPMLGFMGTVIGMIQTFDLIGETGDADPKDMAVGIKLALITTVSGLIVAIILQIFYNYIVSKIDSLVNEMEDASISLVDLIVKHNNK